MAERDALAQTAALQAITSANNSDDSSLPKLPSVTGRAVDARHMSARATRRGEVRAWARRRAAPQTCNREKDRCHMRNTLFAAITVSVSVTSAGTSAAGITWSSNSAPYDHGNYPSAAQGVNTWADAHQGTSNNLWYHVNGQGAYQYDYGYFPTVATDTWGNYIEIHQADSVASPFWFKIGWDNGSGAQYMLQPATQNDWGMSP